jgi:lipoprotein-anchoring transpeptidase ErfK/SrfK
VNAALQRSIFSFSLITATLFGAHNATAQSQLPSMQLAQAEIGMFLDSRGRQVFYDVRTDKILRIVETPQQRNNGVRVTPPPAPPANRVPAPKSVKRAPLAKPQNHPQAPGSAEPNSVVPPNTTQTALLPRPDIPAKTTLKNVALLQILLDRMGISPGVIDGQAGSNVRKALAAAQSKTGRDLTLLTEEQLRAELASNGGPGFKTYTIQPDDVSGPFVTAIPVDYAEKAKLPAMSYVSVAEMLAERFHMDEDYLRQLNPGVNFSQTGTEIRVANPGFDKNDVVVRIEADKAAEQVRAYDDRGNLVAAYPSTIGSAATPSPSGTVTIERIAINPNYTYNPKINFTQGENKSILTIPPGPNGPVGSVWMALSKPTYGIHGTPAPARIGKTNSHGCIRLTNWDAEELAGMVSKGVSVEFLE